MTRWSALAAAAALTLAACGDSGPTDAGAPLDTAPPTTPTDGRDDSMRSPEPVEVVGGGGGDGALGAAEASTMDASTSEMRIAHGSIEYVLGDGMPALPADDTGYVYDAATEVSAQEAAGVAAAFGVDGEPVLVDQGFTTSWRIGPEDGSAPSMWVNDDAQLSWHYSAPWAASATVEPCVLTTDPDGNDVEHCEEAAPPQNVPTAAEAEQRAREILAALGIDLDTLTFETFADEWFASVEATVQFDGRTDTRWWNFGFGGDGVLQYASGSLAEPEAVGPYPLIDLDTALARLRDGFYGGFGFGVGIADVAVTATEAVETVDAESVESGVAEEPPADEPVAVDPLPVEPVPGEPIVITLVDVQPDLWWAWDVDGSAWLLPAYRFIDTDGGWHVVPAVTDEYLIVVEPTDLPEPLPLPEPAPAPDEPAPETVEPEPAPEPEPDGTAPDAGDVRPGTDPEVAQAIFEEYVGQSLDEFSATAKELGYTVRVAVQDGEPLALTADYVETRVNVAVEGSQVVAVESIG